MKKSILVEIIAFFFILLFVYTGVVKLSEIQTFRQELTSSPLLGSFAGIIIWVLPIGEILLAIVLFIPGFRLKALYATFGLMALFTIYVVAILFIDSQISCSCGGIIEELSPKQHIVFNSACVILSTVAIAIQRKQKPTRQFTWITGSSALGLFVVVGWILVTAFTKPAITKTGMEGRLLPSFDLLLPDSVTKFTTADIPTGKPFIVIGFSPWCTHCQAETRDIVAHIEQFKNVNIYYVTPFPFWQMKTFYKVFHLEKYPNITMGKEITKDVFLSYFKAAGVPYTAVFDAQKRLKSAFTSQVNTEKLAQALTQQN